MQGTQVTDIEKKVDYPQFKKGYKIDKQIKEASKPISTKDAKEKTIYVLYDIYGPIGEYNTYKDAEKEMKDWYIDPELYPDGEAGLHIEEETIKVLPTVYVKRDDLY